MKHISETYYWFRNTDIQQKQQHCKHTMPTFFLAPGLEKHHKIKQLQQTKHPQHNVALKIRINVIIAHDLLCLSSKDSHHIPHEGSLNACL